MSILQAHYDQMVNENDLKSDPVQREALTILQCCYDQLCKKKNYFTNPFAKKVSIQGVYLWGGVGLGKTFLMDLFYNALPFKEKKRLHFHAFMQNIQLSLREHQGKHNPLEIIANEISLDTKVLCFDEFFVYDIADAMILERLLSLLFSKGIVLVATSNISPSALYEKGLHQRRFQPAIKLIQTKCNVFELKSNNDYRFIKKAQRQCYLLATDKTTNRKMYESFLMHVDKTEIKKDEVLRIENRDIQTCYLSDKAVWFEFNALCHTPRSQVDYLTIAKKFPVVFISNVPIMSEKDKVSITYFIYLIDIFYDNKTKLYLSTEDEINKLYLQGDKIVEFQRTLSRLNEMQNNSY